MSDQETRARRAVKFQNPVAKELPKDRFRMKRVEDKKKRHKRQSKNELLKQVLERGEEYDDDS